MEKDMEGINFSCCFTGHRRIPREEMRDLYRELERVIDILIRSGVTHFRTGGALGFDTLAALTVLDKRKEDPRLTLELCIPCEDQTDGWGDEDIAIYKYVRAEADKVTVLHEKYVSGCMHERNRYMVDGCHYCVAYCNKLKGGSAYTVGYARSRGVKVVDLAMYLKQDCPDEL